VRSLPVAARREAERASRRRHNMLLSAVGIHPAPVAGTGGRPQQCWGHVDTMSIIRCHAAPKMQPKRTRTGRAARFRIEEKKKKERKTKGRYTAHRLPNEGVAVGGKSWSGIGRSISAVPMAPHRHIARPLHSASLDAEILGPHIPHGSSESFR